MTGAKHEVHRNWNHHESAVSIKNVRIDLVQISQSKQCSKWSQNWVLKLYIREQTWSYLLALSIHLIKFSI